MVPKDHIAVGSTQIGEATEAAPEIDLSLDRDVGVLPAAAVPVAKDGSASALEDLLSEVLFGEIIDISDLIPLVLSAASTEFRPPDTGDGPLMSGQSAMSILYDDDVLASGSTIL